MRHALVGIGLILASIGGSATGIPLPPSSADAGSASPSRDTVRLSATFHPRTLVAHYAKPDDVSLYDVGVVDAGAPRYAGGSILLLRVVGERGPCKGADCNGPLYARFIRSGDRLTYLPKLSPWRSWLATLLTGGDMSGIFAEDSTADSVLVAFLGERGVLETDSETVVTGLAFPRTFTSHGLRFQLTYADEDGTPDSALLRPAFEQDALGWLYTTRADSAPQRVFYYGDSPYHTSDPEGYGVAACQGKECYRSNAFFWFRPDGTYLQYVYKPPFGVSDVRVTDSVRLAHEYLSSTRWGCSDGQADYASVVSPAALNNDALHRIGSIAGTGDSILGLIRADDPYVRAFYTRYMSKRSSWMYGEPPTPLTFAEFTRELPFFFWEDPFGRLIRFTNNAFLPPLTCEPVIYLYPERERAVQVRLGRRVHLLRATPEYRDAWNVEASPAGTIRTLGLERPFLFWEGIAGPLPRPERGFVVRRADVEQLFRRTLPRLGLLPAEIDDFLRAWLPDFTAAPYYRIGFYDRAAIDRYAPLSVTPAPTTVIRVLFDYQPLSAPESIAAPTFPAVPRRTGFTVVEWGGLKR